MKKSKILNLVGLSILCLAYIIVYFHRISTTMMSHSIIQEFNLTPELFCLFSSMYYYPYMFMQIPSGIMADRWGTYKISGIFLLIGAVGTLMQAASGKFIIALAGRFLVGVGLSVVFVPTLKLISVKFSTNSYVVLSTVVFTCGNLGAIIGSNFMAVLMNRFGWRLSLALISIITFIIGIILLILAFMDKTQNEKSIIAENFSLLFNSIKYVLFNKSMIPYFTRSFLSYGTLITFQGVWGGPYLMQILKFESQTSGNIIMMIGVGVIITAPISGMISNCIKSRKKLTIAGGVIISLSWALITIIPIHKTVLNMYIIALFFGIGSGLGAVGLTQVKESFPIELTGLVSGINNFFVMSGAAIIPTILGVIISNYGDVITETGVNIAFNYALFMSLATLFVSFFTKETFK